VLAVVSVEEMTLETDAADAERLGKELVAPKMQVCACAPVAANNETVAAAPTRSPVRNFPLV